MVAGYYSVRSFTGTPHGFPVACSVEPHTVECLVVGFQ